MGLQTNKNAGRRLFEERRYSLSGKVLPFDQFALYTKRGTGSEINGVYRKELLSEAEAWLTHDFPSLYASEHMMFVRMGNRTVYEAQYFERRAAVLSLAIGEHLEGAGRFTDKLIDVLWLMLEETSWVIPAHCRNERWQPESLPSAYAGEVPLIDLFSAMTAATLAFVYRLCRDALDKVNPVICRRLLHETDRRVIKPFLNDVALWNTAWWSGYNLGAHSRVNNWCPWIVSNILTTTALTVTDLTTRSVVVRRALPILDEFTEVYYPDGGCDEGPSYWSAAGYALFACCQVLYDMTGGYIDVFADPLLRNMGEYAVKAIISDKRVLNFADAPSTTFPSSLAIYEWGLASDSEMMRSFAKYRLGGKPAPLASKNGQRSGYVSIPYAHFLHLSEAVLPAADFVPPKKVWLDGIVIAATREKESLTEGTYLALKGGHNAESHNHNDIGNLIVFSNGTPIFIDAGSGTYTKKTFSPDRYTIWTMRSDHHNCATVNGVVQGTGNAFASTDEDYDEASGCLSMQLKEAYPAEAHIESYIRSALLDDGSVILTDDLRLSCEGEVSFHFLTTADPTSVADGSFVINGKTVTYDPSLRMTCERLEKEAPETAVVPERWGTDAIRRITLSGKVPAEGKKFILTVK